MHIEEVRREEGIRTGNEQHAENTVTKGILVNDTKRVLVGAGGRALFYPTLLYNVLRNKIQAEFRWWDLIDEFVLLGAVPFPADVKRLRELGVRGVITLNEPYETLVPTSLYQVHQIAHLVLPTRDYLFAPSQGDICKAVDFIHENASFGRTTYVHCKAGRGRSTTIVICYLIRYKYMAPQSAYNYVKSIRPRVLLASAQWQAIQEFYHMHNIHHFATISRMILLSSLDMVAFDDGSVVIVSETDLSGYESSRELLNGWERKSWTDIRLVYEIQLAGKAALERLSCMWFFQGGGSNLFKCLSGEARMGKKIDEKADEMGILSVDIRVF
ncbi:phosphatidylglycerophosphate phosphatase PTPMT2-like [Impatiens glandulifera]|uniref:phosphatidylglycerophosphate phosphatase PTPMT2-like n=1 Tax=Impatiens glandulifera TaxID=253017 RepID=UPI001FB1532C|nr:phosphatidylglycerophosphate phosphatase PTPMT2-like [Impatiens glandulifera]